MRERRTAAIGLPVAALLIAAVQVPKGEETIGVATQAPDGTIVLQLRAMTEDGGIGDALIRYRPGDSHYGTVARHVGPIPRGGSVFVKPFRER